MRILKPFLINCLATFFLSQLCFELVEVAGLNDITDSEGNYLIENVPAGTLTSNFLASPSQGVNPLTVQFTDLSTANTQLVTCSADGFSTYNNNQVIIPEGSTVNLNISLSPNISGDGMRFVLNWGADPRDLDSHIRTPSIEGTEYHVYYSSQGSSDSAPYVTLDHDDTQSYGPETITIYQFFDGVYHYYIHNFAGVGEITTSSAVVQIYDENGLIYTLQAPTTGEGKYWYVGTIDGSSHSLNIINVIQETEPGTGKLNVDYPEKPRIYDHTIMGITSWEWNFGDGQSSTDQNPSHIYSADGLYTVSLTVGDGINTNQEVKVDYIKVGDTYSIEEMTEDVVKLYPNPAKDNVVFTCDKEITEFILFDNDGKRLINKEVNSNEVVVDISAFKPGIYIVQIVIEGKLISKKLIVR